MTRYFLGVDIGATKSHALIADESGCAVGFGVAGQGNHEVIGYDGLIAALGWSVNSQSQNTGTAPSAIMPMSDPKSVFGVTMTSSPGPIPAAIRPR